ncbi:hypothetical protein Agsp01_32040 [Agromyces sp. NBRC 114283]|nr:hypothetical protein Agsp01_32040 [Agromyces sp. NBRC 114283]
MELSGVLLRRRRRPGLPRRRRIATVHAAFLALVVGAVALLEGRDGGLSAALGAATAITVMALVSFALWPLYFAVGRANLRSAMQSADDHRAIAVRTTADFSTFPPAELSIVLSWLRPWISYQAMTLDERTLTLRNAGRRRWSAGARLRLDRVDSIDVGTANFGTLVERAILVAGFANGERYELGIVPVDATSRALSPVDDLVYRELIEELIARARRAEPSGSGLRSEQPQGDPR